MSTWTNLDFRENSGPNKIALLVSWHLHISAIKLQLQGVGRKGWGWGGGVGEESGVICFASVTVLQQYLGSFVNATLHKTAHTLLGFWGDEGPQVSTWLVSSIDLHRKGQNQE